MYRPCLLPMTPIFEGCKPAARPIPARRLGAKSGGLGVGRFPGNCDLSDTLGNLGPQGSIRPLRGGLPGPCKSGNRVGENCTKIAVRRASVKLAFYDRQGARQTAEHYRKRVTKTASVHRGLHRQANLLRPDLDLDQKNSIIRFSSLTSGRSRSPLGIAAGLSVTGECGAEPA